MVYWALTVLSLLVLLVSLAALLAILFEYLVCGIASDAVQREVINAIEQYSGYRTSGSHVRLSGTGLPDITIGSMSPFVSYRINGLGGIPRWSKANAVIEEKFAREAFRGLGS